MTTGLSDEQLTALRSAAVQAVERAWCPYSQFAVGAALLAEDGSIFSGCNVENASSSLTICAERNAVFQAVAAGQRSFRSIVIYTATAEPTTPCGACRQVLAEFTPTLEVVCLCDGPAVLRQTLDELLPMSFNAAQLLRDKT